MNLSTTSRRTRMLVGSSVLAVGLACGGSAIAYADGFGPDTSGQPTQTEQSAPAQSDQSVQPDKAAPAGPGTDCAAPHPGGPGKGGPGKGGATPPAPPADGEAPTPPNDSDAPAGCPAPPAPPAGCAP